MWKPSARIAINARVFVRALQAAGALGALSIGLAVASAPAAAQGMITLDHAVKNCRLIPDPNARLACYDGVVDEANGTAPRPQASLVPAPPPAAKAPPPASSQAAPVAAAPPAAPRMAQTLPPAATPPATMAEAPAKPKPKGGGLFAMFGHHQVDATAEIAQVGKWQDGSLALTTKDGAVWIQSDLTDLSMVPRPGQTLTIAKTAFGGHLCQFGGSQLFKCDRKK